MAIKSDSGNAFLDYMINALQSARVGVVGRDLFCQFMPYDVKEGVLLLEDLSGAQMSPEIPGLYKTLVLVVVRAKERKDGFDTAREVAQALVALSGTSDDTVNVKALYALTGVTVFPYSKGNTLEFAIKLGAHYALPNC
jgi:hypothetical protein